MLTKERFVVLMSGLALLWLGLLIAPAAFAEELRQVEHPSVDFLYVADDVAQDYRDVFLAPVSVWYPTGHERGVDFADDLRRQATSHLDNALSAHDLTRIAVPKASTLIVQIQYIDLSAASDSKQNLEWASQFRFRVKPGHITMVAETRDAATGKVIMRIADLQEKGTSNANASNQIDLALQQWSAVIASSVEWTKQPVQLAANR